MKKLTPEERSELLRYIKTHVSGKRWICEVLREMYDHIHMVQDEGLKEQLTECLIDAFYMAKRMNSKLLEYKEDYDKGEYEPNKDWKQDFIRRNKRESERG